jgi:hypothetical protein
MKNKLELFWYYVKILPTWTMLTIHNTWGIINVFFIVWLRPMKGGMVDENHPLATGINPETNDYIWPENIIFKSPRKNEYPESDRDIVISAGKYMLGMIRKSASSEQYPNGQLDKMPPAINYIHGGVQYNGGFLIFDDFADAINHFSDREFRRSFLKFVFTEKREPVTLFRNRNYNREEFLEFACFMRTILPFFSNCNGNKKRIGWGNPSPYPAVNTITGYWMSDTYKFYDKSKVDSVMRPSIKTNYFTKESYCGVRSHTRRPEKFLANFTNDRVIARGEKGNMFFVDLRKIAKGYRFDPNNLPGLVDRLKEKFQLARVN